MSHFFASQLTRFLKQTFLIGLILSVTIYGWVRLLFFEMPVSIGEDLINLFRIILCGWAMIMGLKAFFYLLLAIGGQLENVNFSVRLRYKWIIPFILVVLLSGFVFVWSK